MRKSHPEHNLQVKVHQTVRDVVLGTFFFTSVDRAAKRSPFDHVRQKAAGLVSGVPDTLLIFSGRVIGIELKAPGNEPTERQQEVGKAITAAGGHWGWADSVTGFCAILEWCGVPMDPRWKIIAADRDALLEGASIRREERKTGRVSKRRFPKPSPSKIARAERTRAATTPGLKV